MSQAEVKGNMYKEQPSDDGGLTAIYTFQSSDISKATNGKVTTADVSTAVVLFWHPDSTSVKKGSVLDFMPECLVLLGT